MQPLDLNLASKPFRNNTLLWLGTVSAALVLTAFSAWSAARWDEHRRLLDEKRNEVGTFESQRQDLERRAGRAQAAIRQFDLDALGLQASKANEVIDWKAFSWTRLFNHLERVQPWQVRMNSIRPIFHGARSSGLSVAAGSAPEIESMPVQLEGTARTYGDFAELEQALQEDPHFGRIEPQRASRSQNGETLFVLHFMYYPLADEEAPALAPAEATADSSATDAAGPGPAAGPGTDPAAAAAHEPAGPAERPEPAADAPPRVRRAREARPAAQAAEEGIP